MIIPPFFERHAMRREMFALNMQRGRRYCAAMYVRDYRIFERDL